MGQQLNPAALVKLNILLLNIPSSPPSSDGGDTQRTERGAGESHYQKGQQT